MVTVELEKQFLLADKVATEDPVAVLSLDDNGIVSLLLLLLSPAVSAAEFSDDAYILLVLLMSVS
jgi:hypothetical protein